MVAMLLAIASHSRLDLVPQFPRHNALVLSGIPLIAMADFTNVESVLQEIVECASCEGISAEPSSSFGSPDFASDFLARTSCRQPGNTTEFEIKGEDLADEGNLPCVWNKFACIEVIS